MAERLVVIDKWKASGVRSVWHFSALDTRADDGALLKVTVYDSENVNFVRQKPARTRHTVPQPGVTP
jgi:hypothetical protein